jgi:branched-chain amino acid transport system permease protein
VTVSLFFQLLANGIMSGGTYALVASGLTLTLGVAKIFNFAQGDFLMVGAFLTYLVVVPWGLPYPVAVIVALVAMGALGALLYLGVIRRALANSFFNSLVCTTFIVTVIEQSSTLTFAQQTKAIPAVFPGVLELGDITVSRGKLLTISASIVVLLLLWQFMKTKIGRAMVASAENPDVANLQGINSLQIFWVTMAVGCGLSGIAGALIAPVQGAYLGMGGLFFSRALLVQLLGGRGSMAGALIAGFIIGIVESFAFQYVGYLNLIVILVGVAIVMFFRPGGLMGQPMPIPGE